MKRLLRFITASFLFFHFSVTAQDALTIYTEQFPPYNFQQDDKITGINIELLRRMCNDIGILCEFHLYPWNRSYDMALKTKNSGLISTSRHRSREMYFKWVGPFVSSSQRACLYKLKSRTDIQQINKESLKNFTVAVNRNDVYHKLFTQWGLKENKNFLFYSNKLQGVQEFKRGKLDLLMGSPMTLAKNLSDADLTVDAIEPVFHIKDPALRGNYLALNRSVTDDLAVALDNALLSISKEDMNALVSEFVPSLKPDHVESELYSTCL